VSSSKEANSKNKDKENEKRKSIFTRYDEAEREYDALEKTLASKELYRQLLNNALKMSLKGEV
jgi:hypothetical protein